MLLRDALFAMCMVSCSSGGPSAPLASIDGGESCARMTRAYCTGMAVPDDPSYPYPQSSYAARALWLLAPRVAFAIEHRACNPECACDLFGQYEVARHGAGDRPSDDLFARFYDPAAAGPAALSVADACALIAVCEIPRATGRACSTDGGT